MVYLSGAGLVLAYYDYPGNEVVKRVLVGWPACMCYVYTCVHVYMYMHYLFVLLTFATCFFFLSFLILFIYFLYLFLTFQNGPSPFAGWRSYEATKPGL